MGVSPPSSAGGNRSGGGGRARRSYDEQTLQPVTIHMIQTAQSDADDDGLQLPDGRKLHHVKIVAAVRSFENFSTNCVYGVEDGTGLIEVKQWLDNVQDCRAVQELRESCSRENIYLSCTGQIKDYDGKKMITADAVRPVANGNELTYHMLEVVYEAEKAKRQNSYVSPTAGMMGVGFSGNAGTPLQQQQQLQQSSSVGGGGVKDAVLNFVKTEGEKTDEGASVIQCVNNLRGQFSESEIRQAFDHISGEGHIYSTVDENYYKFAM